MPLSLKHIPTGFLQVITVLIGIIALTLLLWLPLTEGRAVNLDLFSIYLDPFILYAYAASIAFFVALYKTFKLLGYIRQNKVFTTKAVTTLQTIKRCAIIFGSLIVGAGIYIALFHHKDDDPAGFIAMSIVITLVTLVFVTAAAVFQKLLQNAIDMKSENDLTI